LPIITGQSYESHPEKSIEEAVFSSSWIFLQEEGAPLPAQILGGQCRGRAPMSYDSVYPTFCLGAQARNGVGRELRRSHLAPQPKASFASLRTGLGGVIDSLLAAQHVLEMFRRALPDGPSRRCLDRLSNRLSKILSEARQLATP